MKKPFEVGDRVRVKGCDSNGTYWNTKGIIDKVPEICETYKVNLDNVGIIYSHRRNLIRLIKKQKRVAREFWVNLYPDGRSSHAQRTKEAADNYAFKDRIDCILVREVLPKKGGGK